MSSAEYGGNMPVSLPSTTRCGSICAEISPSNGRPSSPTAR